MKEHYRCSGRTSKFILLIPSLAALYCPLSAQAGNVVLGTELSSGGDEIVTVSSGDNVKAGELLYLGAGYDFTLTGDATLRLRAMLGYKFVHLNANNGEIKFKRVPLDVVLIKRLGSFAVGGGFSYHLSPRYEGTLNAYAIRINFDNALGGVLQASYYFTPRMELGLRFVAIDYKSNSTFVLPNGSVTNKLNGDSTGIFFTMGF